VLFSREEYCALGLSGEQGTIGLIGVNKVRRRRCLHFHAKRFY
jgi:hypothetical protein